MKTPYVTLALLVLLGICAFLTDRKPKLDESVRSGYQFLSTSAEAALPEETVHLVYWEKWNNFEGEAMQACVDAFNAHSLQAYQNRSQPDRERFLSPTGKPIFVHMLSTTQVNRKTKLAVSGGVPPDIAGLWSRDVPVFAQFDAALPLDAWVKRDGPSADEYQPCYWEMCVYEGHIWALPTTPSTIAMYWNKELFEKAGLNPERPPQSLEELEAFNVKLTLKDKSERIVQMGFHPGEPGWWNYAWGNWFGGRHVSADGRTLLIDSPQWIAAYEWLNRMADTYSRSEMRTFRGGLGSFDSPQNAFISGRVAMVLQGVWMANFIRMYNQSLRWGVAPFPGPGGTPADPVTHAQADVLMIPRGCEHPEEAWKFVRYVNSRGDPNDPQAPLEGMEILCLKQGKHTPFKTTTRIFRQSHSHESLQVFIDLGNSKNVFIEPMMPMWEELRLELPATYEELMSKGDQKGYQPADILGRLKKRLQPKLDQEWERIDRRKSGEKGKVRSEK